MIIEPGLDRSDVWASCKGSAASTLVILCLLISAIFIPSAPEDDGHIRGAAIVIGFLPFVFVVFFVYFLLLALKRGRPFKYALFVQALVALPLSVFIAYPAYSEAGLEMGAAVLIYSFLFLYFTFGIGAWAWSMRKTHNKSLKSETPQSGAP